VAAVDEVASVFTKAPALPAPEQVGRV